MRGEEGEEVCLPAISTVWECAYINYKDVNGKEGWECQWCGLSFKPRHATRAMRHVLKLKGGDIAICKAVISARYQDRYRYQALYDRQFTRVDRKRKSDEIIRDSVTEQQDPQTLLTPSGMNSSHSNNVHILLRSQVAGPLLMSRKEIRFYGMKSILCPTQ